MVDNGPNGRRYVAGMQGMKSHVHEGGIRSPLLLHWPAHLKAGISSDKVVAHIDVTPTILDACGIRFPEGPKMDGRSFLPFWMGDPVFGLIEPFSFNPIAGCSRSLPSFCRSQSALEIAACFWLWEGRFSRCSPSGTV